MDVLTTHNPDIILWGVTLTALLVRLILDVYDKWINFRRSGAELNLHKRMTKIQEEQQLQHVMFVDIMMALEKSNIRKEDKRSIRAILEMKS